MANPNAGLPRELLGRLRPAFGPLEEIERLGGWSVATVWRAEFERGPVVVKATSSSVEPAFYDRIAPELRNSGVGIPELLAHVEQDGRHWLAIEHLPEPLDVPPLDAWRPDPAVIETLARLHAATRGRDIDLASHHSGRWTTGMTQATLTLFPSDAVHDLEGLLRDYEARASMLDQHWCWISGDPSPPNWGRRADGALALYDWELFRPGVPATDLAITVPSLPTREMFTATARTYLACPEAAALPWTEEQLADQMSVAKAGTMVALLAAQATSRARVPEATVRWLVDGMPSWLSSLHG